MIRKFTISILVVMAVAVHVFGQPVPKKEDVLKTLVSVNDYFMKKYADYTQPSNVGRLRPSNIWTRGVYYEGLMALYAIYPQESYYEYTYNWAEFHKWDYRYGA